MKTRFIYCLLLLLIASIPSCTDGEDGIDGIDGEQGPPGADGNANVIQFEFGEQTFTNSLNLDLSISQETVDSSLILVYYNPANEATTAWYQMPGLGPGGAYQTRYFIFQSSTEPSIYSLGIRTLLPDGSAAYGNPVTFRKIRVIFVEASTVFTGVNLHDYNEVAVYLGLDI